ncbi:hypothetical protein [Peribacillus frigoritolerans]|uniref:hypothetical protein n=1 Tax=Peribacillus frigoritolerans TaxID=450367 RepID=UPI0025A1E2FB|nr:hypothetical protein [Peribacillus frigoritolerans]MDM5312497.1 hypothetical protein [Peribacillus frigoritolerans]
MELRNQIIYISKKVLNSIKNFEFNFETTIFIFDEEQNVLYSKSNDEKNDLSKLVLEESVENNAFILSSLQNTTVKTKNQFPERILVLYLPRSMKLKIRNCKAM